MSGAGMAPENGDRIKLSEVPVELVDAVLYNGDITREALLQTPELEGWDLEKLNMGLDLGFRAGAWREGDGGIIVLDIETGKRRIACYG